MYILNLKTGTLHINGMCQDCNPYNGRVFHSEQEAKEYAGKHLKMCKRCEKKKEMIMQANLKNRS